MAATGFRDIDVKTFADLQQQQRNLFLLDVREPFELIAFGAIPNVINIPIRSLASRIGELPTDKSHPIVVICQSGSRSRDVAQYLAGRGYASVYNLLGGTSAWTYPRHKS